MTTLADSSADDAGDIDVAGVRADSEVPALAVVTGVGNGVALDAVAAVPRELAVAGVSADVRKGKTELRVLTDTRLVAGVAVADVARVSGAEVAAAADGVLGASDIVVTDGATILVKASVLSATDVAADASVVIVDAVGDAGKDVAGVAGVPDVAGEAVEAAVSAGPVLDTAEAVPTDNVVADV